MTDFRLALAQINPTVGDLDGNTSRILSVMEEARALGADLVAFPELAVTGYPPEDLLLKPSFIRDNIEAMKRIVAASGDMAVVVGYADVDSDIYNAAAVGYGGELAGVYRKIHLPTYGVFDEDRYFKKGSSCPVYNDKRRRRGCEHLRRHLESHGADSGPAGRGRTDNRQHQRVSPFHAGKAAFRERMVATRAQDNGVYVAYVNTVGGQDELVFDGASMVFDPSGELVARGQQFHEELLVVADLEMDQVFSSRLRGPRHRQGVPYLLDDIGEPEVVHVSAHAPRSRPQIPSWNGRRTLEPAAEVYEALVLGTRDYVKKSGFEKAVIGLSGGIDSSLTACVAVDALGRENVVGVGMPSRYSSEGSVADAAELARRLGIEFWVVPIEPAHGAFQDMLEPYFKGAEPNMAEENVQARIRGNVIMSISNKFGWLTLTTGNKSEMAMGYATLYGDMAGGFAVIKDVPKTLVYRLSRWRNENGSPRNVIPDAALEKPPSAELRPDQTDQDSLPPYEVLDPVVEAYVEEDRSYQDMVDMGFDPAVVRQVIRAVDRTEYKRRQAPPGIKITPRAFGKDRRLPVVNRYRPVQD